MGDSLFLCSPSSYAVERKIEPFYKGGKVQVPARGREGEQSGGGQAGIAGCDLG